MVPVFSKMALLRAPLDQSGNAQVIPVPLGSGYLALFMFPRIDPVLSFVFAV